MRVFVVERAASASKKWSVYELFQSGHRSIPVSFGAKGYDDYTTHKDPERKKSYLARHAPREDWTLSGVGTAGFWSRWLLWNEPSLEESARDIERRFWIQVIVRAR